MQTASNYHLAWSYLIVLGNPLLYMHVFRNLLTFRQEELFNISSVGYFEQWSMPSKKCCSMPFSLTIGPSKSIWISSFGWIQLGKGDHLLCGITEFNLLPISVQALQSLALASLLRWIKGHQIFWAREGIAKIPCYVEWISSNTVSFIAFWIAIRSSMHKHPCLTIILRQYE